MIEFVNAVSFQFVMLVAVVLGAPVVAYSISCACRGAHEARALAHQEKMVEAKAIEHKK
jgi:hypothetical protein